MSIDESVRTDAPRVIIDAQSFSAPPVATVHLPHRVPYGALGGWETDVTLD
jgi:carotenoid cleavage dioxygenase-like enzyme